MAHFLLFLLGSILMQTFSHSHPQYYPTNPEKNWRSVILSRNGPDAYTTTSRPSTTWPSTTFRSFGVEHIQGPGQGSVEETKVANNPRERFKTYPLKSGGPGMARSSPNMLILPLISTLIAFPLLF